MNKKCFKCRKIKDISLFYKHPQMSDGHLGKCKACTKKDVKRRYYDPDSRSKIIEYEKKRFQDPERKKKLKLYQRTSRKRHPGKAKARNKISNMVRDGKLKIQPCEICGEEQSEAHHTDYRKPIDVKWLCRKHHLETEGKQTYLA